MKFSIVVPCFNGMPYLPETLRSILAAAEGEDVEIIVQDSCSTDGSAEAAREILGADRVFVEKDAGQADAVNRGWRRSTGDVLAWINADDLYAPAAFRAVREAFESRPDARWCAGYFHMIDERGREIRLLHKHFKHLLLRHFSHTLLLIDNPIAQMSVFIRRELWQQAGDCALGWWAFDYDYWIRLSKLARPLVIRRELAAFRWHPVSFTGRDPGKLFGQELEICFTHTRNPLIRLLHRFTYWRNALLYHRVKF